MSDWHDVQGDDEAQRLAMQAEHEQAQREQEAYERAMWEHDQGYGWDR